MALRLRSRPASARPAAFILLAAALVMASLPPVQGQAPTMSAQVKVYDSTGATLLHSVSISIPAATFQHFAVATAGHNDLGSGEGRLGLDDLTVVRTDGTESTYTFDLAPTILESAAGGVNDALRHDAAGKRLFAVGNSNYACSTNYEAIQVATGTASVQRARFTLVRATGDTGDGSFWDLFIGLVPTLGEAVQGASCSGFTGTVPTLAGVTFAGDGDGVRRSLRAWAGGTSAPTGYTTTNGATYIVDLTLLPPSVPGAPNVLAVNPGQAAGTATVLWGSVAGATGYDLHASSDGGATYGEVAQLGGGATGYVVTGLGPAPQLYKVRAVTLSGPGAFGSALTGKPLAAPSVPTNVGHVFGRVIDQETVTWGDPASGGATAFNLYGGATGTTLVATLPATVRSFTFNRQLTPAPTHVAAANTAGVGPKAAIPGLGGGAGGYAPGNVDAYALTANGAITVTWTAPGLTPVGYRVYRASSPDAASWTPVALPNAAARSATFNVGADGTKGFFKVTATYSGGVPESKATSIASAVSMAPPYCDANPLCALVVNQPPEVVEPATPLAPRGLVGQSIPISVTATDPREAPLNLSQLDDAVSTTIDWGDGTRDSCPWATGTTVTCTIAHAWREAGRFVINARPQDSNGTLGAWTFLGIADVEDATRPPPPQGPDALLKDASGTFGFTMGDRFGTTYSGWGLTLDVDWGDGSTHGTAALTAASTTSLAHSWAAGGTYCVKARVTTPIQTTPYGECHWVRVDSPPITPVPPSGPASAAIGVPETYTATVTDPEGDPATLEIDWGDATSSTAAVRSGQPTPLAHAWSAAGSHCVKVRGTDAAGAVGTWSSCTTVTVA